MVGNNLRSVERVTGRLTSAQAGAATGAWLGLLFGLLVGMFSTGSTWLGVLVGSTAMGAVWLGLFGYLWRTVEHVEAESADYIHWFNTERLMEVNGDLPPIELEQVYYRLNPRLAKAG